MYVLGLLVFQLNAFEFATEVQDLGLHVEEGFCMPVPDARPLM